MSRDLFSPATLGALTLSNRVVMAPMTRNRSLGNVPGELVATYYAPGEKGDTDDPALNP
jgi:N-ethylmaleimide reductase